MSSSSGSTSDQSDNDTSGLPAGVTYTSDQALPTLPSPERLDVIDVRGLSSAVRLFLTTLQGVVNRRAPRIYLVDNYEERPFTWLQTIEVGYTVHDDYESLVESYLDELSTLVVYDPAVPDTVNLATTIAGIDDGAVATPEIVDAFADARPGLEVQDLRGRFEDGDAVYQWQFDNLWNETTDHIVAGLPTGTDQPVSQNRDYAVATRAMVFSTDWDPDLFDDVLAAVERNGAYIGWFDSLEAEIDGVERCSEHAVFVAPTDLFDNMTVFAGMDETLDEVPANHVPGDDTPELENKVYVTLTYTDGDNLQYIQHRMRKLWDDEGRGLVPINWSISPLLLDAAPSIYAYYQRTATRSDHLMCGPSGLGYMNPTPWPDDALPEFTQQTAEYMRRGRLETMYLLNREDGEDVPLDDTAVEQYARHINPAGVTLNFWPGQGTKTSEVNGQLLQGIGPFVESKRELVGVIEANTPADWDGSEPVFMPIGLLAWKLTPSDIADAAVELDSDYEFVRGDTFFELVDRAFD